MWGYLSVAKKQKELQQEAQTIEGRAWNYGAYKIGKLALDKMTIKADNQDLNEEEITDLIKALFMVEQEMYRIPKTQDED